MRPTLRALRPTVEPINTGNRNGTGKSVNRLVAFILAAMGLTVALSACEVNQTDWRNHSYTVSSQSCLTDGSQTLRNGSGTVNGVHVSVLQTIYGDFTHDGVQDVAIVLGCRQASGANRSGSEIQMFTRDAKPIMRLTPPGSGRSGTNPPTFDTANIFNYNNTPGLGDNLITGVLSWGPNDQRCCPSMHTVYRWIWTGHSLHAQVNDLGTDY